MDGRVLYVATSQVLRMPGHQGIQERQPGKLRAYSHTKGEFSLELLRDRRHIRGHRGRVWKKEDWKRLVTKQGFFFEGNENILVLDYGDSGTNV